MSSKSPLPAVSSPRHKCPFYGFSHPLPVLMDQGGNQCALITTSFSPCQMEINDQTPSWGECPFNNKKNETVIQKIITSCRIAPKELWPDGKSSWDGLPFMEWMGYVMSD